MRKVKATGGSWDPDMWPLYFLAANVQRLTHGGSLTPNDNLLVAANELMTAEGKAGMESLVAFGHKMFLDSGAYWLAVQHAEAHGMDLKEAFGSPPDEMDGFDQLLEAYVGAVHKYGSGLWGYIEMDIGGQVAKTKTRRRLEKMGLRPIPVYHPFNDPPEYFDELAGAYDRVCVGNLVAASVEERKRIFATLWERRKRYPHVWLHALGVTPNETCLAYPFNSYDSSTWFAALRWGGGSAAATAGAQRVGRLVHGFAYSRDQEPESDKGHIKAARLSAYDAIMLGRTLRNIRSALEEELGAQPIA